MTAQLGATYRLQLRPDFGFAPARALVPYLHELGVRDLYLSPVAEAVPGSPHGYDVTDPTRVRAAFGGREGLTALAAAARDAGIGVLLDIVPNHVAAHAVNPWWWDLLRHGRDAAHAHWFDVDWSAGDGRVVLPVLDAPLPEVVAAGRLKLDVGSPHDLREPVLRHHDRVFPLRPGSRDGAAPEDVAALAGRQCYRLMEWRAGLRAINYRRFFDIADLAAVRVEDEEVFLATHRLLESLVAGGEVTAVRVDHVDGLRDPARYLCRLDALLGAAARRAGRDAPVPIIVEKILARDEALPASWPVGGTTGYEFLDRVHRLFVDPAGARRIEAHARRCGAVPAAAEPGEARRDVVRTLFVAEIERLLRRLRAFAATLGAAPDDGDLREALVAWTVALPVYRTYVDQGPMGAEDRRRLEASLDASGGPSAGAALLRRLIACAADGDGAPRETARRFLLDWQQLTGAVRAKGLEDTLLYRHIALASLNEVGGEPDVAPGDAGDALDELAAARQQWPASLSATDTHDAKRGEDTRVRIDALSELAEPWSALVQSWCAEDRGGAGPAPCPGDVHLLLQSLVGAWPPGAAAPGDALAARLSAYMIKAAREAKLHTTWHEPDAAYEAALDGLVRRVVIGEGGAALRRSMRALLDRVDVIGAVNGLAQLAVKMTFPGVPDLYQGAEGWRQALVDPDNRRPVDFDHLRDLGRRVAEPGAVPAATDEVAKVLVTRRLLALRRALPEVVAEGRFVPLRATGAHRQRVYAFERRGRDRAVLVIAPRRVEPLCRDGRAPVGAAWEDTMLRASQAPLGSAWTEWITRSSVPTGADPAVVRVADACAALPVAVLVDGSGAVSPMPPPARSD